MSFYNQKLQTIQAGIRSAHVKEHKAKNPLQKIGYRCIRWLQMLHYEFARDEIGIRAESLSYLTLFSILPVLAGLFLILGFFSQWGPVQNEFEELIVRALQPIPESYRGDLIDFVSQFKNDYLKRISDRSSSLGVFALVVLIWIGGKVYFNIENVMNRIWATDQPRPIFNRIQNFLFCAIVAPVAATTVLTMPGILSRFGGVQVGIFLDHGLPVVILFFAMTFIFKFFPNMKVKWRSAFYGSTASTVLFMIATAALEVYFRFGTETAYGKMAVVPIFAFFIYVFWIIILLGAEVSRLVQNPHAFVENELPKGTFAEAVLMVEMVRHFRDRFQAGKPAITFDHLAKVFKVGAESVTNVLNFLIEVRVILEVAPPSQKDVSHYSLARELNEDNLLSLIKEYLQVSRLSQSFDVQSVIHALNIK